MQEKQKPLSFSLCAENIEYVTTVSKVKHRNKSHWMDDLLTHLRTKKEASSKETVKMIKSQGVSAARVAEIYNREFAGTCARQKQVVTESLKSAIRARCKTDFETENDWVDLFSVIKTSNFLMGKVKFGDRRPFTLSLEWILKPVNLAKILEGAYHE